MPKTRHDIDRATKVTGLLDVAEQSFRDKGYAATTTAAAPSSGPDGERAASTTP